MTRIVLSMDDVIQKILAGSWVLVLRPNGNGHYFVDTLLQDVPTNLAAYPVPFLTAKSGKAEEDERCAENVARCWSGCLRAYCDIDIRWDCGLGERGK